jgi:hypothetical protein
MAEPSRGLQISRRGWLLAGLLAPLFPARGADSLTVTFDGDNLHVAAPELHFLAGKPLDRLKEGSTVGYVARITLYRDPWITPLKRPAEARFLVSYDVLGEGDKFAVNMPGPPPRNALNLSKAATEAWCLDKVWIAAAGMAADRQFWLQLDVRVGNPRDLSSVLGDNGISVDLIDALSKIPGADAPVTQRAGPLRLAELLRTPRGRNG